MEASGNTWSWAGLLMGDRNKQGRGKRENGIPGREISKCQDSEARETNDLQVQQDINKRYDGSKYMVFLMYRGALIHPRQGDGTE